MLGNREGIKQAQVFGEYTEILPPGAGSGLGAGTENRERAGGFRLEPGEDLERGGFPGAVRPNEASGLAGGKLEVKLLESDKFPVANAEGLAINNHRGHQYALWYPEVPFVIALGGRISLAFKLKHTRVEGVLWLCGTAEKKMKPLRTSRRPR